MKVWVIGGDGMLGAAVKQELEEFSVFYIATTIFDVNLTKPREVEAFAKQESFSHIINCAAYTAVDQAEAEKDEAFAINHLAVEHLTKVAIQIKASLIHISTDYVFEELDMDDLNEFLDGGEWRGKAGACMVEGFCKKYIKEVRGNESTAMGLNTEILKRFI